MKIKPLISMALLATLFVSACSDNKSTTSTSESITAQSTSDNKNDTISTNKNAGEVKGAQFFVGSLSETFNAGGYTYVNVTTVDGDIWAAGPVTSLKKGDKISFASKMLMKNFRSKAMDKDFKEIYFVKSFTVNGEKAGMKPMASMTGKTDINSMVGVSKKNPHNSRNAPTSSIALKPMKKAEKGQNIAEIIANVNALKGKTVVVRGQVSKVTKNILGTNWVHIRDNSTNKDLTITTTDTTNVGNVILVKGKLALNKDFGKGFVMNRVIADASVTVE